MKHAVSLSLAGVGCLIAVGAICFLTYAPHAEIPPRAVADQAAQRERTAARVGFDDTAQAEATDRTGTISNSGVVPPPPKSVCTNADALGVSRVVQIDTTGGPGFGFEHFKQLDFLSDKEACLRMSG